MTGEPRSPETDKQVSGVTIGDVDGDIRGSTIAGHDINIGQKIIQFFGFGLAEQRAQRNRRAMLELVKNTWIKGVLEQSLYGAAMIELGMEERAEAVEHPWDMVLRIPDRANRDLPPGTKIVDVFDEMNQSLLILGEPGSGKTTTLLELARDTIARAEQDPTQLIPVVFNLSSWVEKRQSIAEWLVEELNTKYHVPKRIARPWVENDDLLLLLDGLDEVAAEHRDACVEAINGFRHEHGLAPVVVCSRVADYKALTTRLKLQGAILLQALTPQQIDQYLAGAGIELVAVNETLQYDPALQELAQTPLMLSIMTLAYRGMSVEDLRYSDAAESRRKHIFDTYTQQMLKRRGGNERYSSEQTVHWLTWLARQATKYAEPILLVERMQPAWLQSLVLRRLYLVILGLTGGLIGGFSGGLIGRSMGRWMGSLYWILDQSQPFELIFGLRGGLIGGLIVGLIVGLIIALLSIKLKIKPVEALGWSLKRARKGLMVGLLIGLVRADSYYDSIQQHTRLPFGQQLTAEEQRIAVLYCLANVVSGTVIGGLIGGLSHVEIESRQVANQGIHASAKNAMISGMILGSTTGLLAWWTGEPRSGLIIGGLVGLAMWLRFGGLAVIQHYILRLVLWRNGHIPGNLVCFLDHAVDRIFLRKVGGGYVFIHRVLMEYFAKLEFKRMQVQKVADLVHDLPRHWRVSALLPWGIIFIITSCCSFAGYREYMGWTHYSLGDDYVQSGHLEQALFEYARAVRLDPFKATYWHSLCRFGCLSGHAHDVIYACEQAVNLDPSHASVRNSRGIARALIGDYEGAIDDFTFSLKKSQEIEENLLGVPLLGLPEEMRIDGPYKEERWIDELEAGRNPFDEATLEELLNE